jgi:hypothetical protein
MEIITKIYQNVLLYNNINHKIHVTNKQGISKIFWKPKAEAMHTRNKNY